MKCLRNTLQTCSIGSLSLVVLLAMIGGCAQVPSHVDLASALESRKPGHKRKLNRASAKDKQLGQQQQSQQRAHLFANARALEKQGKVAEAIAAYESIVARFPGDAKSLHRLAVCHDKGGNAEASAKLYLRALHHAPHDADLLCDYGYSRYVHGDLLQAESMLQQALEVDPDHSRAHGNMGLVLGRLGRDAEALSAFKRSGLSDTEAGENLRLLKEQLVEAKQDRRSEQPSASTAKQNVARAINVKTAQPTAVSEDRVESKPSVAELAAGPPLPPDAIADDTETSATPLAKTELLNLLTSGVKKDVQYVGDPIRKTIRR